MKNAALVGRLALAAGAGLLLAGAVSGSVSATRPDPDTGDHKVTICHRTNSETNPYVLIEVDYAAVDGAGGSDHMSHDEDGVVWYPGAKADGVRWTDIIPPVDGVTPGLGWTTEGQAIWDNGCVYPEVEETTTTVEETTTTAAAAETPTTLDPEYAASQGLLPDGSPMPVTGSGSTVLLLCIGTALVAFGAAVSRQSRLARRA
ncbi:MAG: hypothetical protein RJB65_1197 [Actinomycetota bacterium]|jgi:hypothetical protein